MSSNETHYNRKEQSANEGGGDKEKGAGRKRQQLSPERAKDRAKKSHKQRSDAPEQKEERAFKPKSKTRNEDRPFSKRADKPFERNNNRDENRGEGRPRNDDGKRPFREGGEGKRPYQKRDDQKPFERRNDRSENGGGEGKRPYQKREDKPFERRNEGGEGKRPFQKRDDKPFERRNDREDRPFKKREDGERKPFERRNEDSEGKRPFQKRDDKPFERRNDREDRPFKKREDGERKSFDRNRSEQKPERRRDDGDKPFKKYVPFEDRKDKSTRLEDGGKKSFSDRKRPSDKPSFRGDDKRKGKPGHRNEDEETELKPQNPFEGEDFYEDERPFTRSHKWDEKAKEGPMTLNKYLAHSGISSRREAASIIKEGKVKVNDEVMLEPGYRVNEGDRITYDDKEMKPKKNLVYILLNKPKGFITTTEDEKGRRTVMELVANAETDRIYPIGRLDRNTTGVLLMTNDGDLTQKLSHPSHNSKKIYQVTLTEPLTKRDFEKIMAGLTLEDGPAPVDALAYLEKKNEIGIEIHSGKNRIVRRIFESLGYVVEKLDRVVFAGLTKKNVSRGKWRFLTEKEVINLKHFKS